MSVLFNSGRFHSFTCQALSLYVKYRISGNSASKDRPTQRYLQLGRYLHGRLYQLNIIHPHGFPAGSLLKESSSQNIQHNKMDHSYPQISESRQTKAHMPSLLMDRQGQLPPIDAMGIGRGLTDPRDHHYDGQRIPALQSYQRSSDTLSPIGAIQGPSSLDYSHGRPIERARPLSANLDCPPQYYSEQAANGWYQSSPHQVNLSLDLTRGPMIETANYRNLSSYPNVPSTPLHYDGHQRSLSYMESSPPDLWTYPSPASSNNSPLASGVTDYRGLSSTLKISTARSRARNSPRHLQHDYLDQILRSKFPHDRMTALEVAIRFRDEHPPTDPIPNELLDQLLDGPEEDKYYCFCCPKQRKARTITPARDHVRKSLGNFPFPCTNQWCRHTSLRQADLNKHMKTCSPPPHHS